MLLSRIPEPEAIAPTRDEVDKEMERWTIGTRARRTDLGHAGLLRPEAVLAGSDLIIHAGVAEMGGTLIYVLHDLGELDLDPAAAGFGLVVTAICASEDWTAAPQSLY